MIERQLVLTEGDRFDVRRNIPLLAVLLVCSGLFIVAQFFPQVIANLQ